MLRAIAVDRAAAMSSEVFGVGDPLAGRWTPIDPVRRAEVAPADGRFEATVEGMSVAGKIAVDDLLGSHAMT
jgi:hypothetical protein